MLLNSDSTIVKKSDGTVDVKQVGDTCPLCKDPTQLRGGVSHIDMYTLNKGCGSQSFANNDSGPEPPKQKSETNQFSK